MRLHVQNTYPQRTLEAPSRRLSRIEELERQIEKLFRRLRMAVIYGGDKNREGSVLFQTGNPRSWKSYETVARDIASALLRVGCRHVDVIAEDMHLGFALKEARSHLAWLNSGGVQGYASVAHGPATLEMLGLPYIGHDPLTAATLDNKHAFKRHLKALGLPTAPFTTWHPSGGRLDLEGDRAFLEAFNAWDGEFIVKPVSGRASLNVHHVPRRRDLPEMVEAVFDVTQNHVLIEGYLPGREYCAAVCGPVIARSGRLTRLDEPFVFACVERVLDPNERVFTSMDHRPITNDRVRPLTADRDGEVLDRLKHLARNVFVDLSLETLVRLDIRANERGDLFVLEGNPKPDLKAPTAEVTSLICAGLVDCGMSYDDLIFSLLADRLDVLLSRMRGMAGGLVNLIG